MRTSEAEPNWWGRPTVEIVNGVAVMVYYNTTRHGYESDGALHIKFSDDYGETWSDEDKYLDGTPITGFPMNPSDVEGEDANEPWLYLAPNGNLLLHMWRRNGSAPTLETEHLGMYQSVSSDGGKTWTIPAPIDFIGITDDQFMVSTDDHFVFDGTIYAGGRVHTTSGATTRFIKSEDNGVSWIFVSDIQANMVEVGLEYVGNNRIVALQRLVSRMGASRAISNDMGATWSAGGIGHIVGDFGRSHIWTRAHLRGEDNWWTDPYLIACGFVFVGAQRRNCLWLSKDSGINWTEPLFVDEVFDDAGYGDMFFNPITGEYVFVCYRGTPAKADLVQYNISIDWGT